MGAERLSNRGKGQVWVSEVASPCSSRSTCCPSRSQRSACWPPAPSQPSTAILAPGYPPWSSSTSPPEQRRWSAGHHTHPSGSGLPSPGPGGNNTGGIFRVTSQEVLPHRKFLSFSSKRSQLENLRSAPFFLHLCLTLHTAWFCQMLVITEPAGSLYRLCDVISCLSVRNFWHHPCTTRAWWGQKLLGARGQPERIVGNQTFHCSSLTIANAKAHK